MSENPLLDYYRQKEIYIKLPTGGKWYNKNPKLALDGEIGDRQMKLRDELVLTVPDALYNWQAINQLIESICPDIEDSSEISLPDVDVLLLASRAATIEKTMSVETKCTHCGSPGLYDIDLAMVLSQVKNVAEESIIENFSGIEGDQYGQGLSLKLTIPSDFSPRQIKILVTKATDYVNNLSLIHI